MDPKAPREKKHFRRLRRISTRIVGLFGRKFSNVPPPALATGGSPPHPRPNTTPTENIRPAVNSSPEDIWEPPVAITGRPAEPATLHTSEEHGIVSAIASQEPRDADANAFECSENVPCFKEAVNMFKSKYENQYKTVFGGEFSILDIMTVDSGSDPTSHNRPRKPMGVIGSYIQSLRTYLPSLGSVQTFATALSRLDPHGIAPLVVTSVLFVIQLTLNTLDPGLKERILTLLSKTSTMMNKWILYEVAQARRITAYESKHSKELAKLLPGLYLQAFQTISLILQALKTKIPSLVQGRVPSIERSLSELERFDRACAVPKDKVDADLKSQEENLKLLNWIRGDENPEPSHTTVVCRSGLDKPDSQAALWLLNTSEFKSWVAGLALEKSERVFWLKGIMGTGKTSLICRLISHFEQYPIHKTRVVFYYCSESATGKQNIGPGYEDIIRGLCYRLTWNDGGEVAHPAKDFYQQCESEHDRKPHIKRWELLLENLIIYNKIRCENRLLFIIDALDECSVKANRLKFLKFVRSMEQHGLYLILSSRPHTEVKTIFMEPIAEYSVVSPEAKKDMKVFIDDQIAKIQTDPSHSKSLFLKDENLERLSAALISQANGMFRWVQLWLGVFFNPNRESIVLKKTAKAMLEMLESGKALPAATRDDDIVPVYQKLWDINGDGDENRKLRQTRVFRFVLAAKGLLHENMLLDAIRFDPEPPCEYDQEIGFAYLETLYHNFLRKRRGFLEFEHVSAKTFILEMQDSNNKQCVFANDLQNHRAIAEISIRLLRDRDHKLWKQAHIHWDSPKEVLRLSDKKRLYLGINRTNRDDLNRLYPIRERRDHPNRERRDHPNRERRDQARRRRQIHLHGLAVYVLSSWLHHCRIVYEKDQDTEFRWRILEILRDKPGVIQFEEVALNWTGIHCDIRGIEGCHLVDPLVFALTQGISPFHFPNGMNDAAQNFGDIMARNAAEETTLQIAVRQNDHRSVKAILDIHLLADSSAPLLYSVDSRKRNLLHVSRNDDVVRVLLETEAKSLDPSTTDERHNSTLLQAVDDEDNTPIHNLLQHCSENLVMWVMEKFEFAYCKFTDFEDTYCGATGSLHHPISHVAVRRGFKDVIRILLLDRGASIDGIDCPDGTALGVAAAIGDEDMTMFLLQQGADVNRPGGDHGTALGAAVYNGRDKVVDLFLGLDDLNLERAIRLSPYDHDEMWNRVGDQSMEVAEILQHYGRRYAISADESAGDLKK